MWEQAGTPAPASAFADLGDASRRLGSLDAAESALQIALERATDPLTKLDVLLHMSRVAFDRGDHATERALVERAATLAEPDDAAMQAKVLASMAWSELRHGDIDEAERLAAQALRAAEHAGASVEQIDAHSVLGGAAASRDDLDVALEHAQACLELAHASGDLASAAVAWGNLGVTLHLQGDATGDVERYRAAIDHYEMEYAARVQLADRIGQALSRLNQAQARLRLGDHEHAHIDAIDALVAARAVGAFRPLLFALLVEADTRLAVGAVDLALPLLGVVSSHPEADRSDHDEIQRIISRRARSGDRRCRAGGGCRARLRRCRACARADGGPLDRRSTISWTVRRGRETLRAT